MALNIGSYVGGYRLLRLLSTGQSSQVWESLNDLKQERFALKVLLSDTRSDRLHRNFLKNEYEVGKTLDHPRVVRFQEYGTHQGDPYLAMELYSFPNLKYSLLRDRERMLFHAEKIIAEAAEGLGHLHERGWVHRDVKPDNFLVSPEGDVKLIDFALSQRAKRGLARLLARRTNVIQGTRSYMSPEQIRGQPIDARSDMYSFGCMVHEMLGGKTPFTGVTSADLLTKHLRSAIPSLGTSNSNVTGEFGALVRRMLAKEPADRPKSMDEFLLELRGLRVYKSRPALAGKAASDDRLRD